MMSNAQKEKERKKMIKEAELRSQRALEFYAGNGMVDRLEDVLNAAFVDQPIDLFGYFANYFEAMMHPAVISGVSSSEVLDSRAMPVLHMTVNYVFKNVEQKLVSVTGHSLDSSILDHKTHEQISAMMTEARTNVQEAASVVAGVQDIFYHSDGSNQAELDAKLKSICEDKHMEYVEELKKRAIQEQLAKEEEEASKAEANATTKTDDKNKKGNKSPKAKKSKDLIEIGVDEPKVLYFPGSSGIALASQIYCVASAALKKIPLHQHLAQICYETVPSSFKIPIPLVPILASGKMYPGKLNYIKEFYIIPSPEMNICEALEKITKIYAYCAHQTVLRQGVVSRYTSEIGATCSALDKVDQGLDHIIEAVTELGFEVGKDFYLGVGCNPWDIYDSEKNKYEVMTGLPKGADEMAEYWEDICNRYPALVLIIDPMRREEKEPWMQICAKISAQCFVAGDLVYGSVNELLDETADKEWKTSAVVTKYKGGTTLTTLCTATRNMQEELNNVLILSSDLGENNEGFVIDLAVALRAQFVKLGSIVGGENMAKYNRLVELEKELISLQQHDKWTLPFQFPSVRPPTPPAPPEPISEPTLAPATAPSSGKKGGRKKGGD